ncbi:MAG: hypothetical protein VB041_04695 [Candidatus Limiplasma sp.]|nr:hypothetical protein [Candidatus Limiplasma sp.]
MRKVSRRQMQGVCIFIIIGDAFRSVNAQAGTGAKVAAAPIAITADMQNAPTLA